MAKAMQGKEIVNVLVLEDDDFDFNILERRLCASSSKYNLIRASDIAQARTIAAAGNIDVGLVDYRLGGALSGVDFITELGGRQSPFPMIVLTGLDDGKIDREALLSGAYDYVDKNALTEETADRALRFAISSRGYEQRLCESIKKAEEQASINRRILAVVSHEMHSPLRSIIGYCDNLSDECGTDAGREAAARMKVAATHLEDFLRNLSEFVRLDSGSAKLTAQPFSLREMIEETIDFFRPYSDHKAVRLECDISAADFEIIADRLRLRQILINLLRNAVTFTDEGTIGISASLNAGLLSIEVRDDGTGMPTEKVESIMTGEPGVLTPDGGFGGGLGIGLSICQRLLRLMGGAMSIESSEGVGTKVRLTVPVRISNSAKAA